MVENHVLKERARPLYFCPDILKLHVKRAENRNDVRD